MLSLFRPEALSFYDLTGFHQLDSYPSLLGLITSGVASEGVVYLRFADLRDAVRAFAAAQSNTTKLAVQYITPMHFANKHQTRSFCQTPISSYEGQLIVFLTFVGHTEQYESDRVILSAKEALGCYGDVMILRDLHSDLADLVLRVEFYNIHAAATVFTHKDSLKIPVSLHIIETDFKLTCEDVFPQYRVLRARCYPQAENAP